VKAGTLDRRVTLQRQFSTRDAYGGETISWIDVATVWASVSAISGREFLQSQQIEGETTYKVVIRWLAGITTSKLRVVYHDVDEGGSPTQQIILDVVAILPSADRKRYIQFMCRAGVNDG
jgi:SPP1 family predicted phage head-tail adaptor